MLSAGWVIYALLTGTLVAVACHAADGLARAQRLPTRWVWAAGLGAMLLLGGRSLASLRAAPVARTLALPGAMAATASASAPATGIAQRISALLDAGARAMSLAMVRVARLLPPWLGHGVATLWLLASAVALLVMALVHLRLARLRRAWPRARLFGHDVRVAPAVGPAVIGVMRPFIVVPRWLLTRSDVEQRLVLAHEHEHLAARDHVLLAGATIAAALVPWHPVTWWMLSRLRLALELDCDARVLRRGVAPKAYGTLLVDLAGQCTSFTAGATALADESTHLHRRLLAMTPRTSRFTHLRAGALCAIAGVAILAACEAKIPTSAEVENMDVASAEKSAAQVNLVDGFSSANTTYFIDDVQADAATAHALPRNRIASIQVRRANGTSEMRIATLPNGAVSAEHSPVLVNVSTLVSKGDSSKDGQVTIERRGPAGDSSKPFEGVVFIDGVQVDRAALKSLDPRTIVSMEVIKGPKAARESSDPAAANGIIRVTTKAAAPRK